MNPDLAHFGIKVGRHREFCDFIIVIIFVAHQHKAACRKARLDIQNYGCNGNLLCDHGVVFNVPCVSHKDDESQAPICSEPENTRETIKIKTSVRRFDIRR